MNEWNVIVSGGVGFIGTVHEKTEDLARCAALSKYGEEGERVSAVNPGRKREAIYEDDDFSVSKRGVR